MVGLISTVLVGAFVGVEVLIEITVGIGIGVETSAKLTGVTTICIIESRIISQEQRITKIIAILSQEKRDNLEVRGRA